MAMTTMTNTTSQINDEIERLLPDLIEFRHDLHAHPELAFEEHRTSQCVQDALRSANIEFQSGLAGGTGVLGHLPGSNRNAIALRADMDALPITETPGKPYCSKTNGKMHACGHDGHTTILIGAARVLASISKQRALPRPVTFCFQPAEEGGGGGLKMVEDGCLDGSQIGPPVSEIFGLHGWPGLREGHVGSKPGPMLAATTVFDIEISGTGSHAASPHLGTDPILTGTSLVPALQRVVSRNVDPVKPLVLSVTQVHAGTTHNIIPDVCTLQGTIRSLDTDLINEAKSQVEKITELHAKSHNCKAAIGWTMEYPVTINDPALVDLFHEQARATLGEQHVCPISDPIMGGEDFAYYGQVVPACFFALGLLKHDQESMPTLHQCNFDFNDDAIATGIAMFCNLALRPQDD